MTPSTTVEALLEAARAHGLELTPLDSELDVSGADFVVAHALDNGGARWILRSPRRADVMDRAAVERRALDLVRPRLDVAVPNWRVFAPELIGYPRLEGEPAASVDVSEGGYVWRFDVEAPPAAFLESLADAIAALHGIDPEAAGAAGLPVRTPAEVRTLFAARAERARERLVVPELVWRRWQAWLAEDTYWPDRAALVHGDLHPPHILLDSRHRVVGLLDWTEAHVGDAATDFSLLYATMGRPALKDLLSRYEAGGRYVWPRMEAHVMETWSAFPLILAEFAATSGDEGPRQLAQVLVDANAAELAAG